MKKHNKMSVYVFVVAIVAMVVLVGATMWAVGQNADTRSHASGNEENCSIGCRGFTGAKLQQCLYQCKNPKASKPVNVQDLVAKCMSNCRNSGQTQNVCRTQCTPSSN